MAVNALRTGRYVQQPQGFRAFIPKGLPADGCATYLWVPCVSRPTRRLQWMMKCGHCFRRRTGLWGV
jgi:hypothetical protein